MNIQQLMSEKDWLVWKFQVQHALKATGQWEFITGTADTKAKDYVKKSKRLSMQCYNALDKNTYLWS